VACCRDTSVFTPFLRMRRRRRPALASHLRQGYGGQAHEGQSPRHLQEKGSKYSLLQCSQKTRAKCFFDPAV
jgi:hypothetical protein